MVDGNEGMTTGTSRSSPDTPGKQQQQTDSLVHSMTNSKRMGWLRNQGLGLGGAAIIKWKLQGKPRTPFRIPPLVTAPDWLYAAKHCCALLHLPILHIDAEASRCRSGECGGFRVKQWVGERQERKNVATVALTLYPHLFFRSSIGCHSRSKQMWHTYPSAFSGSMNSNAWPFSDFCTVLRVAGVVMLFV
jgi:hypothetical protein